MMSETDRNVCESGERRTPSEGIVISWSDFRLNEERDVNKKSGIMALSPTSLLSQDALGLKSVITVPQYEWRHCVLGGTGRVDFRGVRMGQLDEVHKRMVVACWVNESDPFPIVCLAGTCTCVGR